MKKIFSAFAVAASVFSSSGASAQQMPFDHVFGVSALSQDAKSVFLNSDPFWKHMTKVGNKINLETYFLDNFGAGRADGDIFSASYIALADQHLDGIKRLQDGAATGFQTEVIVGGFSPTLLIHACANNFASLTNEMMPEKYRTMAYGRLAYLADVAVHGSRAGGSFARGKSGDMSYMSRLSEKGIKVSEILIDGPVFGLLQNSPKGPGCHVNGRGGYRLNEAVILTNFYMKSLRDAIAAGQGGEAPKVDWIVNLVNWPYAGYSSLHWGQAPAYSGADFSEALRLFRALPNAVEIDNIVLDYPYDKIEGQNRFTNLTTGANTSNGRLVFESKVKKLDQDLDALRLAGDPTIGVYLNTSGRLSQHFADCNYATPLLPYVGNYLTDNALVGPTFQSRGCHLPQKEADAILEQTALDEAYFKAAKAYYQYIRSFSRDLEIDQLFFSGWHENPRFNKVHGHKVADLVDQLN